MKLGVMIFNVAYALNILYKVNILKEYGNEGKTDNF